MCKFHIVKCFPEKRTLLKCCCFNLTYYKIFVFQTIFTVGFHFFDIGSDIAVLVDLNQSKSEYFSLCLIIILLPTIANFIRSLGYLRGSRNSKCLLQLMYIAFFHIILQGNFFYSALQNVRRGKKTQPFVQTRMNESLLESAPESLFQLFIILKDATTHAYNQITIYYLSITLSIFSLIMSLVSYEIFFYNDVCYVNFVQNPKRTTDYSIPFDITEKEIKSNSRYIILLTFYRLTEILSRVGLLACIGNIYDGYFIIWFLLGDLLSLCVFNCYNVVLNCEVCNYICYDDGEDGDDEEDGDNRIFNHIYLTLIVLLYKLFDKIKNLAVFSSYFLSIIAPGFDGPIDINTRSELISGIKYHFMSRYLNNTIISILIIYNLSINTYSYSIFVISISSIGSFILNILFLYLILKYICNYKKYQYIFKPMGFHKCVCNCNKIEDIEEEKNSNDIEDDIEEKNPDDIFI